MRVLLLALLAAGCGHLDGRNPNAPTPPNTPPAFTVLGPQACTPSSLYAQAPLIVAVRVEDAGSGILGFNTLVAHGPTVGCGPVYSDTSALRLLQTAGPTAYSVNQTGTSFFEWRPVFACGRAWIVITANRATAPQDIVVATYAVTYPENCS